jgi:hypothetical protein
MPMLLEIIIYLLLILSIMFVTWLYIAYDNKNIISNYNCNKKYIRKEDNNIKVNIMAIVEGTSSDEAELIGKAIAYGNFDNIYDLDGETAGNGIPLLYAGV